MRILAFVFFTILLISCKEDASQAGESQASNQIEGQQFKGQFLYVEEMQGAVLQTQDQVYAVKLDDTFKELDQLAQDYKRTPYDMVQVIVTGDTMPNPKKIETGQGWDQMLVIDDIIEVKKAASTSVTRMPQINSQEQDN
jgi:hypothetical protein